MSQLKNLIASWKASAAAKQNTAQDHVFYIIYSGILREQSSEEIVIRLKQALPPVTSPVKMAHGRRLYDTLKNELGKFSRRHYKVVGGSFYPPSYDALFAKFSIEAGEDPEALKDTIWNTIEQCIKLLSRNLVLVDA